MGGVYDGLDAAASVGVIHHVSATRDQLQALYRSAEALVFPSVYEGLGLPVREALSVGTPVVAMPFSAIPEIGGDRILSPSLLGVGPRAGPRAARHRQPLPGELPERGLDGPSGSPGRRRPSHARCVSIGGPPASEPLTRRFVGSCERQSSTGPSRALGRRSLLLTLKGFPQSLRKRWASSTFAGL